MGFFAALKRILTPSQKHRLSNWYHVRYDDEGVTLDVQPPKRPPWTAQFLWTDVTRVCFQAEDYMASDQIYVFTKAREESYAIPIEADGGQELWKQILDRELFDPHVAIVAAGAVEGLFCWPQPDADELRRLMGEEQTET